MAMLRRSPYHHRFEQLGAHFVERIGFAAPAMFSTTEEEHHVTRERVGLFDVYYQVPMRSRAQRRKPSSMRSSLPTSAAYPSVASSMQRHATLKADDRRPHLHRLDANRFWLVPTPRRVEPSWRRCGVRRPAGMPS